MKPAVEKIESFNRRMADVLQAAKRDVSTAAMLLEAGIYLEEQGFSDEDVADLLNRKLANKNLVGTTHNGRYASFVRTHDDWRLREMLESGQPPMSNTDREFLEGQAERQAGVLNKNTLLGDFYKRKAQEAGVDITGKVYLPSLAAEPGDPRAWVGGRGDVQKLCEERGYNCRGSVNVQSEVKNAPVEVPVAPDLVMDRVQASQGEDESRPTLEVAQDIAEKMKPHWVEGPALPES